MSHFNRLYYAFKPYIPWRMRLSVRRWFAVRKRRQMGQCWPILNEAGRQPAGWPGWPDGKRFAFVITHDVESGLGVAQARELAELELGLGFRSSFNFVPEGDYETPESLRRWLQEKGFEVGVHDLNHDGWLYQSRAGFREKAAGINRYLKEWKAVGFRSGFMHHNYEWLHDLDVLYDGSSFDTDPFEPQPDGVGTIFPFWIDNPSANARTSAGKTGYVELPYTLPQDSTLFLLFREREIDTWTRKLEWIAERGGMALLNVHPDYLAFRDDGSGASSGSSYPVEFYERFLTHVRDRYAGSYWHATPRVLAEWFRSVREVRSNVSASA